MTKTCIPLAKRRPVDNRNSYDNITWLGYDWAVIKKIQPVKDPATVLINNAYYATLDEESQEWFRSRNIVYRLKWNKKIGLFLRVPARHAVLAKLSLF